MNPALMTLLAGLLAQAAAVAQTVFPVGQFSEWQVPKTGWYQLEVSGAQGGKAGNDSHVGGNGATIKTSVRLDAGLTLKIGVGQMGGHGDTGRQTGGGGGGASSVIIKDSGVRLVIAGGGGGGASDHDGSIGRADNMDATFNGSNGNGGSIGTNSSKWGGAGGGGFFGSGGTHYDPPNNPIISVGGQSYVGGNGSVGISGGDYYRGGIGGWGGGGQGGGADSTNHGGGGGGGGYSGGGGGVNNGDGGAGGGSFVPSDHNIAGVRYSTDYPRDPNIVSITDSADRLSGHNSGDGSVEITFLRESLPYEAAPDLTANVGDSPDFDSKTQPDLVVSPSTVLQDGYLELTPASPNSNGTAIWTPLAERQRVKHLVATFEVQLTDGSSTPADGFSFNFGPNLKAAVPFGQEPVANGLSVAFDTFDDGGGDTGPAVEVFYDKQWKAGVSFNGVRSGGRLPSYPVVEDQNGYSQSLTTGSSWVPVQVELSGNDGGGGVVTVTWNGIRILNQVAVPFSESAALGWQMGFGAQTGSLYQAQRVRNIRVLGNSYVTLDVLSNYSHPDIRPAPGRTSHKPNDTPVTFSAPASIYLDRYGKVLNTGNPDDDQRLAAYKALNKGVSINGARITGPVTLSQDSVASWEWELQYLAEVNTGTETIQGLAASSVTDPQYVDTLGRNFRAAGYNFNSVVYSQIMGTGTGLDIQFQPKGYVIENAPDSPERFLQLSGSGEHLRTDSAGSDLIGTDGSFTLEFWARRDPVKMTADQNVVAIGSATSSGGQLRAGFTSGNAFFLSNNGVSVQAPAGWTDGSWHHWAAVNDMAANTVTLYRDGKVVASGTQALTFSGSTQTVAIGARANGSAVEGFFPGGVNNVRVWKTALGINRVRSARTTIVMGGGQADLGLEMPFDTPPVAEMPGVYVERREGSQTPATVADALDPATFPVATKGMQDGFSFPAPPAGSGPYYGWTMRTRLRIDVAANYTFGMSGGDGGQLWIDGVQQTNPNGQQDDPSNFQKTLYLSAGDHVIELLAYDAGGGSPSLTYKRDGTSETLHPLPNANLRLLARDQLTFGVFSISSAEGRNVSFVLDGADQVFPNTIKGAQMVAALLPGFRFNPLDTTTGATHNIDPSEQGALTEYRRVFWMWDKKFRFKVDVSAIGLPEAALTHAAQSPYFKMVDGILDSSNSVKTQVAAGILTVLDLWLAEGEKLEVGALYRSPNRRYTLSEVGQAMNNFANIDFRAMLNGSYNGQAAKSYSIPAVSAPGSLTLTYAPTIFRAQLAIGEGLDFSSPDAIDTQLTPDLPDDAVLVSVTANSKPAVTAPDVTQDEPGWTAGEGDSWQWDIVGMKWYPLKPGVFTLAWKDKNTGETYNMEVTAGFPATTRTIAYMEDDQGHYLGSAPDYETDYTFKATAGSFPAAPGAHYRYLVSPNAASLFPVDLDSSATDRWTFLRQAFSTQNTAKVDKTATVPRFTESSPDNRTVLVFSYRPTNAVASGDLNREQIAVRVVESLDPALEENQHAGPAQKVASRITSADDTAGYGSGCMVNEVSNYNASIYDRSAAVGQWGPVYPVNRNELFTDDSRRLSIGYYENPGQDPASTLHPPVGWPYVVTHYDDVTYPDPGSGPAIYIASQLGSEGVSQSLDNPQPQLVFDPARYTNLTVYNQPDRDKAGYNPNEEHALVAPSNLAAMTGDSTANTGQSAFFALQNRINRIDISGYAADPKAYTSEPFVLAQYFDTSTGLPAMRAYEVLTTRGFDASGNLVVGTNDVPLTSEFPARDPKTHLPLDEAGNPVPQPSNPRYEFKTVTFAGDLVTPIYPLNLVLGGRLLNQSEGGNVRVQIDADHSVDQQTLWHDKNGVPWSVAGDFEDGGQRFPGRFFYRHWYPLAQGFWLGEGTQAKAAGTPVCWLPDASSLPDFTDVSKQAQKIDYSSYWKENYPVLKRGETLAYAGGESKADHPAAPGLPGVIGWASAEVAFDSATRDMVINNDNVKSYNARFMRLLDIHAVEYAKEAMPEDLTPAHADKVSVSGSRWYFKELGARLNQRFYYDSLAAKLVLRGTMNGMESGDPKLTQTPLTAPQLLCNVLDEKDVEALKDLSHEEEWTKAIEELEELNAGNTAGLVNQPLQVQFYDEAGNTVRTDTSTYRSVSSLGVGTTLVPNPESLTEAVGEEKFVTVVENNDPAASGAVTLHVIRLGDERYRGSIAVITPKDAFDEKVELMHTGDFGGNTAEVYYQWWVHDVAPLDGLLTPDASSASGWTIYQQGKGLTSISFAGDPTMTLADKLFYVRYGHAGELGDVKDQTNTITDDPETASVTSESWCLVDPDATAPDWGRSNPDSQFPSSPPDGGKVPYQWAGAANSPQLQASGKHRFLPQLLMGWVKRVLDAVNPYEARYSADFTGDSPATYTSMLVQAGRPYNGPVALNADKDVIENVGLIELYETVLQRAKDLSGTVNDPGINQALLLASTRLAMLYELLAGEAYTDALNSSLALTTADTDNTGLNIADLAAANPYVFAFTNEVPSLLQEELSLLRGTDYLKSYPCQNRLFWNYFKGIGEAAYNANYNIKDVNKDGLIDESDAAALYPMGHGDAWGHFISASKMHYGLLQRSNYDWQARAELYSLLGNVIPTDYLDEQSFARTAAARARCGLSIVKATYRDAYVADPAAQWQGYTDAADPARAWGVSEWGSRVGQGAVFDWMVGNAILPASSTDPATGKPLEGLNLINRQTTQTDLRALSGSLREIQLALDAVNAGATPIGVNPDTVSFGLEAFYDGSGWELKTHFEQTYESAVAAAANARQALDFVSSTSQTMRQIADDTGALKEKAIEQDIDYRNRLIALLGTPYQGAIGAGQIFKEGYTGPDTVTYMYLDATTVEQLLPGQAEVFRNIQTTIENDVYVTGGKLDFMPTTGLVNDATKYNIFDDFFPDHERNVNDGDNVLTDFNHSHYYYPIILNGFSEHTNGVEEGNKLKVEVPISLTSQYAFKATESWGRRAATGEIQNALGDMLRTEVALETAIDDYQVYLNKLQNLATYAQWRLASLNGAQQSRQDYLVLITALKQAKNFLETQDEETKELREGVWNGAERRLELTKQNLNIAGGELASFPAALSWEALASAEIFTVSVTNKVIKYSKLLTEMALTQAELLKDNDKEIYSEFNELIELLKELSNELQEDPSKRLNMAAAVQDLNMAGAKVRSLEAEANRLLGERAAMNKMIASRAQTGRYGDMIARLSRDDAARKYESAMDTAVRFAWLAAKAYDYETSLSPGHPANAVTVLEDLVKVRQLGQWDGDTPRIGNGGLAEILAKLKGNYEFLKGNLGLNNPQAETSTLSLRTEAVRNVTDDMWKSYLASSQVDDLNQDADFSRSCRPFASPAGPAQPGFKIEFSSEINSGKNFFGKPLSAADHAFSSANFATKIRSVGVGFSGYDVAADGVQKLAATPRVYFVPAGMDIMRYSDGLVPQTRGWNVVTQRIPVPFPINTTDLRDYAFNPAVDSLNGSFAELTRLGDFRAYPTAGGTLSGGDPAYTDSQLFSRSVWNTRWILFIPAASLGSDQKAAIQRFIDTVTDIQLQLTTFSSYGM